MFQKIFKVSIDIFLILLWNEFSYIKDYYIFFYYSNIYIYLFFYYSKFF